MLANRDGGANAIHWNDAGGFERASGYGTGSDETRGVAVGDVDGDGRQDIVTANIGEVNAVYFGDAAGGFERSLPFGSVDDESYAVRLADVDLDGDLDIIVANVGAQNAVYFNRGAAGFDEFRFGCEDCATYGVAVGDLNGDGFPEIVTANSGAQNGIFGNVGVGRWDPLPTHAVTRRSAGRIRLPDRPKLIPLPPVRPVVGVGQPVAQPEEQAEVVERPGEIP